MAGMRRVMALVVCGAISTAAAGRISASSVHDGRQRTQGTSFRKAMRYRGGDVGYGKAARKSAVVHLQGQAGKAAVAVVEHAPEGEMSVAAFVINLVADLCPHGMLPVAYGMAAGAGTGLAVAPALLAAFGVVSGYTLVSIGRASQRTGCWSFRGIWGELVGPKTAWVVELAFAVMTFGCCIFYAAFIGDLFASLAQAAAFVPAELSRRPVVLSTLSAVVLLPLCLMKNLKSLQYTSFGGVISIAYTAIFVAWRFLDGSYAPGGRFYKGLGKLAPSPWRRVGLWKVGGGLVTLMNVSCVAFMAHYNGVKYYEELKDRTVKRCAKAVGISLAISFAVFASMMVFGFGTFGAATQPLLLNNYHPTDDAMAMAARLCCGLAILCGYPLMFAALKSTFGSFAYEVLGKFESTAAIAPGFLVSPELQRAVAVSLQVIITAIACSQTEKDVAVVIGLIGALLGGGANYIIPAIFNLKILSRDRKGAAAPLLSEATLNKAIIAFGLVFMAIGTYATLQDSGHH